MNVFDLSAKISLDSSEYVNGLKSAAKIGVSAMAAVTAAAVAAGSALSKQVIDAYGSYEQLVGGVEKLFGDEASKAVIANAENAFKTAGLSANAYMETVTSFSASLISSLGGDTQKAVDYADMALRDMSDNANVFGTDIGMIQSAYQGFAKQNYMMLDNLKLGYGGTKTEMERLIADANELKVAQGGMADLTIESYADIVEAIHLVQTEMNITGTTAKEASQTIEGSINSLKGAVTNLWTEFGKGDGDIKKATRAVTNGFQTMLKNIVPVVQNIAKALPDAIKEAVKQLPKILPSITKVFNGIVNAGFEIIKGFIASLPSILQEIPKLVRNIAQNIVQLIRDIDWLQLVNDIVMGALTAITGLFQGIVAGSSEANAAWYAHRDAVRDAIVEYQNALEAAREMNDERQTTYDNLYAEIGIMEDVKNKLIEYTDEQGNVKQGYEDEMGALVALAEAQGIHIDVVNGEIQGYSDLISSIDVAIEKRKAEAITAAETSMYEEAYKERRRLDGEYQTHYQAYLDNIMKAEQARAEHRDADADAYLILANDELEAAKTLKEGIVEYSAQMELASHNMAAAASGDFDNLATTYDQAGIDLSNYEREVQDTTGKIQSDFEKTFGVKLPKAIKDGDEEVYMQLQYDYRSLQAQAKAGWQQVGDESINGLVEKLEFGRSRVIDASVRTVRDAINAAKAEAQISSPSKRWAWMGDMMTQGLVVGMDRNLDDVIDAATNIQTSVNEALEGMGGGVDLDLSASKLRQNDDPQISETESALMNMSNRMDNLEELIYNALSRVLSDGVPMMWNDRELTRLVKEHA